MQIHFKLRAIAFRRRLRAVARRFAAIYDAIDIVPARMQANPNKETISSVNIYPFVSIYLGCAHAGNQRGTRFFSSARRRGEEE